MLEKVGLCDQSANTNRNHKMHPGGCQEMRTSNRVRENTEKAEMFGSSAIFVTFREFRGFSSP